MKSIGMRNETKKAAAVLFLDKILKRNGGPSTYLYNLCQGVRRLHSPDIRFISVRNKQKCVTTDLMYFLHTKMHQQKRKEITYVLFQFIYVLNDIEQKIRMREYIFDACQYQVVHVHHVADAVALKVLGRYKGTIILTMHTPEPWSEEVIHNLQDNLSKRYPFKVIWSYQHMLEVLGCFFADSFIFPSKASEDTYLMFDFYKKSKGNKNVDYLLTGVPEDVRRYDKREMRRNLGIPEKQFVLLFVGRHNKIKGYDMLVSCQECLQNIGVYVVCAGKTSELDLPKESSMWKELGWHKNVNQLYDLADAVILPNRETYFDLAAIEALSRGRILIASATGGNRTLANFTEGVLLFEAMNVQDMICKIVKVKDMKIKDRIELENKNRQFYEENCTSDSFAKQYREIVHKYI